MRERILSIDPSGTGTTGIYYYNGQEQGFKEFKDIHWRNHYNFIVSSIKLYQPNLLLFENTNFISNRTSDSLNLIRLLGAIECLAVKEVKSINVLKVKEMSKALFKGIITIPNLAYLPGRGKGWIYQGRKVSIHQLEAFIVWWIWKKNKISIMVNAQQWLDKNYPKKNRKNITNLNIGHVSRINPNGVKEKLEGYLDLRDFVNAEEIHCPWNEELTDLKLPYNLKTLECQINSLNNLDFLNQINPKKLSWLIVGGNKISPRDLTCFSQFTELENLNIGTRFGDNELVKKGFRNSFNGSLEPLKKLTKLKNLGIENTDINSGLEYLPDSLVNFEFKGITELEEELKPYGGNINSWRLFLKDQQIVQLQQEKVLFIEQKSKIDYLQVRIAELNDLNKEQIEKIFNALSRLLPKKELLGELIKTHLEFIGYKNQGANDSDYSKRKRKYERKLGDVKDELEEKLTNEQMNSVEGVLNDFEKLVEQNLELEEKLNKKSHLIANHKQTAQQIKGPESDRIVELEEEIQEQQIVQYKRQRSHSVIAEIANLKGQIEVYKETVISSRATIINTNTNTINDNSRIYDNTRHDEHNQSQFHQQVPPKGSQS